MHCGYVYDLSTGKCTNIEVKIEKSPLVRSKKDRMEVGTCAYKAVLKVPTHLHHKGPKPNFQIWNQADPSELRRSWSELFQEKLPLSVANWCTEPELRPGPPPAADGSASSQPFDYSLLDRLFTRICAQPFHGELTVHAYPFTIT